jgi:carbon-monoxide dehydrogenase medium subunit
VKPPPFRYLAPASLEAALELRAEHAGDSAVLAGGQSLLPMLNLRLAFPSVVIDLARVPGLAAISAEDGGLSIGAMTRQRDVETSALVRERCRVAAQALAHVGHVAIRNRGTIGGSLAHADPAAELPAVALLVDAELVVRSARGERRLSAEGFFLGFMTTALEPDELLVEIRLPPAPERSRSAFVEFSRRHGDFAVAGAAARVAFDDDGTILEARLSFVGVHPTPVRVAEAETMLRGARPDESVLREAAELAASRLEPSGDAHGSAAYRRRLAAVVARRALAAAAGAVPR